MKIYIVVFATLLIFWMFVQAVPENRRDIQRGKLDLPDGKRYVLAAVEELEGRHRKIVERRQLAGKRFARDATGKRKLMDHMHRSIEQGCEGARCKIYH